MIGFLKFTVEDFENEFANMKKYMDSYADVSGSSTYTCLVRQSEETNHNIPNYLYFDLLIDNKKFSKLVFEAMYIIDQHHVNYIEKNENKKLSELEEKLLYYIYKTNKL